MGARITGNATGALVSSVKPNVSVSVVFAVADVSYVLADATVYYVQPVLDAYLDTTGEFKFIMEVLTPTDAVSLRPIKNPVDSVSLSDTSVRSATKGLSDLVGMSDTLTRTLIFIRNLADSVGTSDYRYLVGTKALLDSIGQTDIKTLSISKKVTDGFAMSDTSSLNDGAVYAISKYITNIATPSDYSNKAVAKASSDMVTEVDSGYLYSQGYCDLTYFAEDYVGSYRTF